MKRSTRAAMGRETVEILEHGRYVAPSGRTVELAPALRALLDGTRYVSPAEAKALRRAALAAPSPGHATALEVVNETTLAGVQALLADGGPVAALNFASAKNPGGGFLSGAEAQEESLARSSALHASQIRAWEFYERHRASPSLLYSDAMILSPGCPVFRDDDGVLLEEPLAATFLTAAAPNAGAMDARRAGEPERIPDALRQRAEGVLALAANSACPALVLGAWGCGVFRNDPALVAVIFAELLLGAWQGRFRRVRFSVLDRSAGQATYRAFAEAFAPG